MGKGTALVMSYVYDSQFELSRSALRHSFRLDSRIPDYVFFHQVNPSSTGVADYLMNEHRCWELTVPTITGVRSDIYSDGPRRCLTWTADQLYNALLNEGYEVPVVVLPRVFPSVADYRENSGRYLRRIAKFDGNLRNDLKTYNALCNRLEDDIFAAMLRGNIRAAKLAFHHYRWLVPSDHEHNRALEAEIEDDNLGGVATTLFSGLQASVVVSPEDIARLEWRE